MTDLHHPHHQGTHGHVSTEDAKKQFENVEEFKPYLRYADAPK